MSDFEILVSKILNGEQRGFRILDLEEFKKLYRILAQTAQKQSQIPLGETKILLLSRSALVKFSSCPNFIVQISGKHPVTKKDFDIVLTPIFEGNINPITWKAFIWTEFLHNWWIIILSLGLLFGFSLNTHQIEGLSSINQSLIDANALFVGVFVLFTISQNRDLLAKKELLQDGTTHQLMQNDYYLTSFAITSLILALFSNVIVNSSIVQMKILIPFMNKALSPYYLAISLTCLSFALLLDCFVSVTKYYLRVQRTAIEGQMYKDLMGNDAPGKKEIVAKSNAKERK
jgi:hypothetical protein